MVALIPTPKRCELRDNKRHALPLAVFTAVADFSDAAVAFIDACSRIYEATPAENTPGGVELMEDPTLAPDAYVVDTADCIRITASTREGAFYGVASALQLIEVREGKMRVQDVHIEDYPDKPYRSFMITTGRVFHTLKQMKKYVDLCFFYKVKYLHLHLTDDDLYSLPSKAFPKLSKPGKHFTYEEIAALNEYAAARGIVLIPELDCPGHAAPLCSAYPEVFANHIEAELDADGNFHNELGEVIKTGSLICAGSQRAFEGIKALLREIAEMFPNAPFIHIGGDEAKRQAWDYCDECQRYMKENGIADSGELYSDFVGRAARFVLELGRRPMVWEGFPPVGAHRVPKETVVIAWEAYYHMPQDLLAEGFEIINASWQPTYITTRPERLFAAKEIMNWNVHNWQHWSTLSLATDNPIQMAPTAGVLGGTLCGWSMRYEQMIGRLLENLPAMAERTWAVEQHTDFDTFCKVYKMLCQKAADFIAEK